MREDIEGQESFPFSAVFELTTQGLLVQEHNYSATTHARTCTHAHNGGQKKSTHTISTEEELATPESIKHVDPYCAHTSLLLSQSLHNNNNNNNNKHNNKEIINQIKQIVMIFIKAF